MKAVSSVSIISVGQSVSAELPNITGSFAPRGDVSLGSCGVLSADGAFALGGVGSVRTQGSQVMNAAISATFDASRCSSIYKDSATTVVPESLITNFYIKY